MARVQGEGDYESARRYNSRTRKFVAQNPSKPRGAGKKATGAVDEAALRKARSKAKAGAQDKRDAAVFRKLEGARGNKRAKRAKPRVQ